MKRLWRDVLDEFKADCVAKGIKNITIPKDKFGGLLSGMLEKGAANMAANIKSGFAACGIAPLDVDRLLSRLPPAATVGEARESFCQQLTEELRRKRFGDPQQKRQRATKSNRLPPGKAYTVSATPAEEEEEEEPATVPARAAGRRRPAGTYRTVLQRKIFYQKNCTGTVPHLYHIGTSTIL
jgi:hypothetical protein